MKARTELLLYKLEWLSGKMMRPTWRSLDSSFESWAYGSGLLRQIQRLEVQAFLEIRKDEKTGERLVRLTEKGQARCGCGFDPEEKWSRNWDGKWRMIIFDVPETERAVRSKLRQRLINEGFGCLQQSVWVTPDSCSSMIGELRGSVVDGSSLTMMEAVPIGGESAGDIVKSAWDFDAIEGIWRKLAHHIETASQVMRGRDHDQLAGWMEVDRRLIRQCRKEDPLLPLELLPKDYSGRKVWSKRLELMPRLAARFS